MHARPLSPKLEGGTTMSPAPQNHGLAVRMGRWSAAHWRYLPHWLEWLPRLDHGADTTSGAPTLVPTG